MASKKAKNGGSRRNLQSNVWPTRDVVFGWNSDGRVVDDWAFSAAGACCGLGWWQWSNNNGRGWRVGGQRKRESRGGRREVAERGDALWLGRGRRNRGKGDEVGCYVEPLIESKWIWISHYLLKCPNFSEFLQFDPLIFFKLVKFMPPKF